MTSKLTPEVIKRLDLKMLEAEKTYHAYRNPNLNGEKYGKEGNKEVFWKELVSSFEREEIQTMLSSDDIRLDPLELVILGMQESFDKTLFYSYSRRCTYFDYYRLDKESLPEGSLARLAMAVSRHWYFDIEDARWRKMKLLLEDDLLKILENIIDSHVERQTATLMLDIAAEQDGFRAYNDKLAETLEVLNSL